MSHPVSDTRTLAAVMFTDIAGFTAHMQEDEALARQLRDRYRTVLEETHKKYDGRIIQHFGDGALSMFSSAVKVVQCAIEIQRQLREPEPVEVPLRIGIHSGDIVIEPDTIIGDAVNLASRIESFSVPGAVLISGELYQQIRNQPQFQFQPLGAFRFKNVELPVRLYALSNPGLIVPVADELRGKGKQSASRPSNLPRQLTSFVGREQEMEEIRDLIRRKRLVTLTGPGGTGKTRLALKVAESLPEDFRDGICWSSLAPVSDANSVSLVLIKNLDLVQSPEKQPIDILIDTLQQREILLVFDNFEHVLEAAPMVGALLQRCPGVKALVTSRIVLNLQMEQEYPLHPLQVPVLNERKGVESLLHYPVVELFCQRAKAVKPPFELDEGNMANVVAICHRLDGLPLAIELAAARIKIFSPQALLTRLDRHLDLLRAENPDRPVRHRTLRQTISWSYQLLNQEERTLFNRLSVFAGGASLEAIESVCCQSEAERWEAVDRIYALVNKSLVNQEDDLRGEPRFYLLETIRTFAREQLTQQEDPKLIQTAHARYFVAKAEEAQPHLTGPEQVHWLSLLEKDLDNFREVLHWTIAEKRHELAFRLGIALWRLWTNRAMLKEGVGIARRLLECRVTDELKPLRARIVGALIAIYFHTSDFTAALPLCRENLNYWRQAGNEEELATNLNHLGFTLFNLGNLDLGVQHTEEALELCKKRNDLRGQAVSNNNFGWGYVGAGRPWIALPYLEESLRLRKKIRDDRGVGFALINLARTQTLLGMFREAEENYTEGLNLLKKNKNRIVYFFGIINLGLLYWMQNEVEKCAHLLRENEGHVSRLSLSVAKFAIGWLFLLKGFLTAHERAFEQAHNLVSKGIQLFEEAGMSYFVAVGWHHRSRMAYHSGNSELAWEYLKTSLDIKNNQNLLLAENLEWAGMLFTKTGEPEKAALLLAKAGQMRQELHTPVPPVIKPEVDASWKALEDHLSRDKLEELLQKGREMEIKEALELIGGDLASAS